MPRRLTDAEVDAQKEFMYERTVELISQKGISSITLDDILDAVQMAKGSFYKYYVSKELFLYEVMRDLFTNKDFLFMSLLPEDIEILLRKTPPSYRKQEKEKSKNNFITFCQAMSIVPNEEFFGTLSYLMLALQAIITSPGNFDETGQKKAILIMMQAIYGLIIEETENNEKNKKFNKKLFPLLFPPYISIFLILQAGSCLSQIIKNIPRFCIFHNKQTLCPYLFAYNHISYKSDLF